MPVDEFFLSLLTQDTVVYYSKLITALEEPSPEIDSKQCPSL